MSSPPSGDDPGDWQPMPPGFAAYLLPQWRFVTPFAIPTSRFFRPNGLPPSTAQNTRRTTTR